MFRSVFAPLMALLFAAGMAGPVDAAPVRLDAELEEQLRTADPDSDVAVIIRFAGRTKLHEYKDAVPARTSEKLILGLRQKLARSQQVLRDFLKGTAAHSIKPLWLNNSIGVTLPARLVRTLSRISGLERISLDVTLAAPIPSEGGVNGLFAHGGEHANSSDASDYDILPNQDAALANNVIQHEHSSYRITHPYPANRQLSGFALVRYVGARGPPLTADPAEPGMAAANRKAAS